MANKMKNMLSSNVHNGIPLKVSSHKARILQMGMKLISSTPIRNSETRNNVDESDQLGSPIARVNSADVSNNENPLKEIIPSKTYSNVKPSTSAEYKNTNNPKNLPGHNMVLYSSGDDDIFIVKKKLSKETNRKRKIVSLKKDSDSDVSPKYTKHNVDNVENIHIDKVGHVQENNKDEKLINKEDMNRNNHILSNEISDNEIEMSNKELNNIGQHDVDDNKMLKRKNAKKKKTDDTINVQNTKIKPKAVNISVLKNKKIKYSSKESHKNKINKETTNKKILQQTNLKLSRSVTRALDKALHLHSAESENNLSDNKKKPKLQSNKKEVKVQNETKENKTDHSEKNSKRKVKLSNAVQNLKKNVHHQNDEVKETSEISANGIRKSSRQHIPPQTYWTIKSNSEPSNYTDTSDSFQYIKNDNIKEQISKNTEHKSVQRKTKIPKLKQQKQTKSILIDGVKKSSYKNILMQMEPKKSVQLDLNSDNLHTNPNNDLHLNRFHNLAGNGSEEFTQNQNTDLDSCNTNLQTEANILHEQDIQTKLVTTYGVKESLYANTLSIKQKSPVAIKSKTNEQDLNRVNLNMNPDDIIHSNGIHNSKETGSKKVTRYQNTDLDSRSADSQTKANILHEKEKQTKRTPAQKFKSSNSSSPKKQKNSSANVDKQAESDNLSNDAIDINVDPHNNIPFDTLIDFHKDDTSKPTDNNNAEDRNCENIIDKYSFKEIALAQRRITEIEHSKQFEYFGKFPQIYRPHPHDSNLSIGINISNSNFISGVLEIVPSGKKPREYPKKNNMFFFVLEGCAEICVGDVSKILRIGDSFFVPSNTPYYIINLNNTKRLLVLFTKHAAS